MEENRILEKIRKLLAVTKENGATEGEVENAMKLAQRLMMQHNIDESEINISPLDIDELKIENEYLSNEPKYWIWDLLNVIGKSYTCMVTRSGNNLRGYFYRVVGTNQDRIIVKEIFLTLLPVVRNLTAIRWKEYIKTIRGKLPEEYRKIPIPILIRNGVCVSKSVFTGSYLTGFNSGLYNRLKKDREEFLSLPDEKEKWGLIVIKKDDLIQAYLKEKLNAKACKLKGQKEINDDAYFLGIEDGKAEGMNKQLQA